jgi:hypothetical protein
MYNREYENIDLIDDPLVVLDFLYTDRYEWKLERCLVAYPRQTPYVRCEQFSGAGSFFYSVSPRVVNELQSCHAINGAPQWGYTDNTCLTINDYGRSLIVAAWEKAGADSDWDNRLRAWRWFREWRPNEA